MTSHRIKSHHNYKNSNNSIYFHSFDALQLNYTIHLHMHNTHTLNSYIIMAVIHNLIRLLISATNYPHSTGRHSLVFSSHIASNSNTIQYHSNNNSYSSTNNYIRTAIDWLPDRCSTSWFNIISPLLWSLPEDSVTWLSPWSKMCCVTTMRRVSSFTNRFPCLFTRMPPLPRNASCYTHTNTHIQILNVIDGEIMKNIFVFLIN